MIDRSPSLLVADRARELGISRGNVDYLLRAVPGADLQITRRMEELYLALSRLRAAGCCATCCGRRASRSVASMSRR